MPSLVLCGTAAGTIMGLRGFVSAGGESTADNCQILQTRVNRFKSDKEMVDATQLRGYSCDVQFTGDWTLFLLAVDVMGYIARDRLS